MTLVEEMEEEICTTRTLLPRNQSHIEDLICVLKIDTIIVVLCILT